MSSIDISTLGAKGDGLYRTDAVIDSGTATLTSTTGTFAASDIDKHITIDGAGPSGAALSASIIGHTSAQEVTLNTNASTDATGNIYVYGTDNTDIFDTAFTNHDEIYVPPSDGMYMIHPDQVAFTKDILLRGGGFKTEIASFFSNSALFLFSSDVNAIKISIKDITLNGGCQFGTASNDQDTSILLFNALSGGNESVDGHGLVDDPLFASLHNCWIKDPIAQGVLMFGSDTEDTEQILHVSDCLFTGGATSVNSNLGRVYVKATNASNIKVSGTEFLGVKNDGGETLSGFHGFSAINMTSNKSGYRSMRGSYIFTGNRAKYCGNLKDNVVEAYSHSKNLIITSNIITECNAVGGVRCKTWNNDFIVTDNVVKHCRRSNLNSNGIVIAGASTNGEGIDVGSRAIIANNIVHDVFNGIIVIGNSPLKHAGQNIKNVSIVNNTVTRWGSVGISIDAVTGANIQGNLLDNSYFDVADMPLKSADFHPTSNSITIQTHSLDDKMGPFRLKTTDTLPAGLSASQSYWVSYIGENTIKLMDAREGGAIVEFSDQGTGDHTMSIYRINGAITLTDMKGSIIVNGNNVATAGNEPCIQGAQFDPNWCKDADLTVVGNHVVTNGGGYGIYTRWWRSLNIKANTIFASNGTAIRISNTTEVSAIAQNTVKTLVPLDFGTGTHAGTNDDNITIGTNFL